MGEYKKSSGFWPKLFTFTKEIVSFFKGLSHPALHFALARQTFTQLFFSFFTKESWFNVEFFLFDEVDDVINQDPFFETANDAVGSFIFFGFYDGWHERTPPSLCLNNIHVKIESSLYPGRPPKAMRTTPLYIFLPHFQNFLLVPSTHQVEMDMFDKLHMLTDVHDNSIVFPKTHSHSRLLCCC